MFYKRKKKRIVNKRFQVERSLFRMRIDDSPELLDEMLEKDKARMKCTRMIRN